MNRSLWSELCPLLLRAAFATLWFFGAPRFAAAQEPPPDFFGFHPMSTMSVSRGLSLHAPGRDYKQCIVGVGDPEPGGTRDTRVDMILVTNSTQLKNALKLDVSVDASYLAFKGGAKFGYSYEGIFNEHSMNVVISATAEFTTSKLSPTATLSESANKLLTGPNGAIRFAAICGTHYVSTEKRGSSVSVVVSISGLSSSEKTEISAEMSGSGGWGPLSVNAAAKFQQQLSKAAQSGRTRIQVVATGGDGFGNLGNVVKSLATGENSLAAIMDALGGYMKQFSDKNFARVGFYVRSMEDFGWDPKAINLWSDFKARRLVAITEEYRNTADEIESARGILAGTDARTPIISADVRAKIPSVINTLEERLAGLAGAHQACMNADASSAAKSCPLPEPLPSVAAIIPEMPEPANGRLQVVLSTGPGSQIAWDSGMSRAVLFDRPQLKDRAQFLGGVGFLEAIRVQEPKAVSSTLRLVLTGEHLVSATLKFRAIGTSEATTIALVPIPSDRNIAIFSALEDNGKIRSAPDFLGKVLTEWWGNKKLANGSEFFVEVRDRLGRSTVVRLGQISEDFLVWAR